MQQTNKWDAFVSLTWYDSLIEFLFRFVAKTSEPLLALGIVISAADFLDKGQLMRGNAGLSLAWAWCQAIAIEASSGVVFVYALQSFKCKDKVKGWFYLVLSVLLAITGGAMLLLQLVANITGAGENTLPGYIVYGLAVLRVVVSIGYVYMCRAKHIRFTDLEQVEQSETSSTISDDTVQLILSRLEKLDQLEQVIAEQKVTVIQEAETPLALPETAGETPETEGDEVSLEVQIAALLAEMPGLSSRKVATIVGRPHSTVYRMLERLKQS